MTSQGIGASLLRKEDDRGRRGRGAYVGDIRPAGLLEVAFLRSSFAHARLVEVKIPPEIRDRVFIAEDLDGVKPIRADTALPGFKSSVQPVLASEQGAPCRRTAWRCASRPSARRGRGSRRPPRGSLSRNCRPSDDMLAARKPGAALVHEHWGDNLFLTTEIDANFEAAKAKARAR